MFNKPNLMMMIKIIVIIKITAKIKITISKNNRVNNCRNNYFTGETEEVYSCIHMHVELTELHMSCELKNAFSLGRTRKQFQ